MPVFVSPWAFYEPEEIPDLNPHNKEEGYGCLAGFIAMLISTVVFVCISIGLFHLKMRYGFSLEAYAIFILANTAIIYPLLTILLMKKGFKIVSWIFKKKNKDSV